MNKRINFQEYRKLIYSMFFIRFFLVAMGIVLLVLVSSCSSIPTYKQHIESFQDIIEDNEKIEKQSDIISFLEYIINSEEYLSIEAFSRKTFSPNIKQTKLLTHSFYLINLPNGRYCTLSFSGSNFSLYSDGYWVLNKETDLSSYKLFVEENNIWCVKSLFFHYSIDAFHTFQNIISAINIGMNYYYRDHLNNKPNHLNCNTAITETIVINQEI